MGNIVATSIMNRSNSTITLTQSGIVSMSLCYTKFMSESGKEESFGRVPNKSWMRKGRKADLTDVSIQKLDKASRERGVTIDLQDSEPGKRVAQVDKIVVKGDD